MSRRKRPAELAAFELPAQPPATPEEQASSRYFADRFNQMAAEQRARNLANGVLLAQQAACGYGPLVDHFAELGRRYVHLLTPTPGKARAKLQVVPGGLV